MTVKIERIKRYLKLRMRLEKSLGRAGASDVIQDIYETILDAKYLETQIRNIEGALNGSKN